jgi:hypothetical protein
MAATVAERRCAMSAREPGAESERGWTDARVLVELAARRGVTVGVGSAQRLNSMGFLHAKRKIEDVCRVVDAAAEEDLRLTFTSARRRLEACGGDVEKAIHRLEWGDLETREGMPEAILHAGDLGVNLEASTLYGLIRTRGREGTLEYISDLADIIDTACTLGIECPQTLATRRLALAGGDASVAIVGFRAQHRRRMDRLRYPCSAVVAPRGLRERANAYAGCGCPSCLRRLAAQLQGYIAKMVANSPCSGLTHEEASAEANRVLLISAESWPGGNFTGWFSHAFKRRMLEIYASRSEEDERLLYLDAPQVLWNDGDGRLVSLGERVTDRTASVEDIVLQREQAAEEELKRHRDRIERIREFHVALGQKEAAAARGGHLRLLRSGRRARWGASEPASERRAA